jgi:hypothetical protein
MPLPDPPDRVQPACQQEPRACLKRGQALKRREFGEAARIEKAGENDGIGGGEQAGYHGGGNDIPDRRDMRQEQKA